MERLGNDIIIQAGSGVLGHPNGPYDGGRAIRAAVETALAERSIALAAHKTLELAAAIEKWGYLDGKGIHTLAELWENEETLASSIVVNTQGGSVVFGNVTTQGGSFIGRDQSSPIVDEKGNDDD